MTIDETIKYMEMNAEDNQKVIDTRIVYDDVTIDMLYCDDTEVIEEHLAKYQEWANRYKQIADWLKELKQLREQTRWIPVDKDLPPLKENTIEISDNVLITDGDDIYTGYLVRRNGKTSWHIYEDVDVDVIAWMPSLKPYKVESDE